MLAGKEWAQIASSLHDPSSPAAQAVNGTANYITAASCTQTTAANRVYLCAAAGFITAALDAGVPVRDVQEAASHADPRTTMRYDRARGSLDRHATYIVAAYLAGAARSEPATWQELRLAAPRRPGGGVPPKGQWILRSTRRT